MVLTAGGDHLSAPLIGVFVSAGHLFSWFNKTPPPEIRELSGCGNKSGALLYFFSLGDVDFQGRLIRGLYYHREEGCWQRGSFPLPRVVYFRNDVSLHQAEEFQRLVTLFNREQVKAVNYLFSLNKWEVHRLLEGNPSLREYLPATVRYRRHSGLMEGMLKRYGTVYLKACHGSRGHQVVKVRSCSDNVCEYSFYLGKLKRIRVRREELERQINRFFQNREFIIQQALDLVHFDGGQVDLRAEVQRNGRGELELVGLPVRVGHKNAPITTHARSFRFEDFFGTYLDFEPAFIKRLAAEIMQLVHQIYSCVEGKYGPCGELGIDLGMDKSRRLWFIECNSRSARVSLGKAYGEEALHRSFTNPLAYACHLAGGDGDLQSP